MESHPCEKTRGEGGIGALALPNSGDGRARQPLQALTGVDSIGAGSTGAGSMKLRPRRSGPNDTMTPSTTMVKISNPASAQL